MPLRTCLLRTLVPWLLFKALSFGKPSVVVEWGCLGPIFLALTCIVICANFCFYFWSNLRIGTCSHDISIPGFSLSLIAPRRGTLLKAFVNACCPSTMSHISKMKANPEK